MYKNIYKEILEKVSNGEKTCIISSWVNKEGVNENLHKNIVDVQKGIYRLIIP